MRHHAAQAGADPVGCLGPARRPHRADHCLFYFSHGVAEAWSSHRERWLALLEVALTVLLIGLLGAGVRRRPDPLGKSSPG